MKYMIFVLTLAVLLPAATLGQSGYPYPRTRRSGPKVNAAPPSGGVPNPTFEGTLKMLTHKEIVIQLQSEQTLSIRRDRKTKFVENDKEIKPESIAVGTPLAVDVKEDLDLKPMAVRVVANPAPPKSSEKTPEAPR
jgi:hypothetical protein